MSVFKTKTIAELEDVDAAHAWLIRGLWPAQGVGIIAAEPKCGKTWLALDVAVSIASGTKCLGVYEVEYPGKVLFFNGEDAEHIQGDRLNAIVKAKGLDRDKLKLEVIIADSLRLDLPEDVTKLRATVALERPILVILDPFVRLHQINENNSKQVAVLLAKLRQLQKDFGTAVILVHHSKKLASKNARGGQKMRGSGELHAWGDANLYLNKTREGQVTMDIELRTSESVNDVPLALLEKNGGTALEVIIPKPAIELVPEVETVPEVNLSIPEGSHERREPLVFKTRDELTDEHVLSLIPAWPVAVLDIVSVAKLKLTDVTTSLMRLQRKGLITKDSDGYHRNGR